MRSRDEGTGFGFNRALSGCLGKKIKDQLPHGEEANGNVGKDQEGEAEVPRKKA